MSAYNFPFPDTLVGISFGSAIRFLTSAFLSQAASVADFRKFVFSTWVRCPSGFGSEPALAFGNEDDLDQQLISQVFPQEGDSGLFLQFVSREQKPDTKPTVKSGPYFTMIDFPRLTFGDHTTRRYPSGFRPTPVNGIRGGASYADLAALEADAFNPQWADIYHQHLAAHPEGTPWPAVVITLENENPGTPPDNKPWYYGYRLPNVGSFSGGAWHHVLISGDFTIPNRVQTVLADSVTGRVPVALKFLSAGKLFVAIDDEDVTPTMDNISGFDVAGIPRGCILPEINWDGIGGTGTWSDFYWISVSSTNPSPTTTVEPFDIALSGYDLGVPAISSLSGSVSQVDLAFTQLFTGVSIDTKDVAARRKFIRVRNGLGNPAKLQAAKGVGTPIIICNGGPTRFILNRGSAGTMSLSGSVQSTKRPRDIPIAS